MKIFLFLFLPVITHAQIIYKGDIINKATREKIPFATVGLTRENTGINADENGAFSLASKNYANDSLIISCVGYETTKFPVDKLPPDLQYEIMQKQVPLKTVVIKSNYPSSATLNDFSDCGNHTYTSSGSITQVAQYFHSPEENSLLSEINICRKDDNSLFRIRVYDMDTISGMPSADLADTIIEVRSRKEHVHLDMKKYNIIIPGKDFFVAIEWLYIPYNVNKVPNKKNGKNMPDTLYSPFISLRYPKTNDPVLERSFKPLGLAFHGHWIQLYMKSAMMISAKVKY